jgi:MYXO-CTERM domain-containing protein
MRRAVGVLALATATAWGGTADAFCGFYVSGADAKLFNNATQVVLMREGTKTVLSMQNNYQGPPSSFAMVVPVPVVLQKENVKTLERAVFSHIDQLGAPRLVEYWEQDPCEHTRVRPTAKGRRPMAPSRAAMEDDAPMKKDLGVRIEAQFTVGEYDVVVLSAKDSGGLDTWLRQEKYTIPAGAEAYLRPYVQAGSKFFVAKVDVSKVKFDNGMATLSPLRFHYDTETFSLPVRLGLMNSNGTQDLIVNILAKGQRYEVSNYPNATIPTNFDVAEPARGQFGSFYAALFDRTLEKIPKVVVTEYAWDAGSCDPCPSPPLSGSEIAVLGGDVLAGLDAPLVKDPAQGGVSRRPGWRGGGGGSYVLTRLHARYAKDSLGEDLVFRAAAPIMGGREMRDGKGALEHGSAAAGTNNFQGRYAIRHPWTGPITCKEPQRGNWGGPPGGREPTMTPATNIAFAPRGKLQLATFVKGSLPDVIALPGAPTPLGSPVVPVPASTTAAPPASGSASGGAASAPMADAGAPDAPPPPTMPSTPPPPSHGCGCSLPDASGASGGAVVALVAALAAALRRRKR